MLADRARRYHRLGGASSMKRIRRFTLLVSCFLALGAAAQEREREPQPGAEESAFGEEVRFRFNADLLDRAADPCRDLYQLACGGWLKANPVPPEYAVWSRAAELEQRDQRELARILTALALG